MSEVALSDAQVENLARPLVATLLTFYENEENEKGFQKWLQQRQESEKSTGERS